MVYQLNDLDHTPILEFLKVPCSAVAVVGLAGDSQVLANLLLCLDHLLEQNFCLFHSHLLFHRPELVKLLVFRMNDQGCPHLKIG